SSSPTVSYPLSLHDALPILGVMILFHVQSFPTIPGQKVGPALFPGVIAAGLAVCASILIVQGIAGRRKPGERSAWLGSEPWMRSDRKSTRLNSSHQIISYAV